jgi:hypothetical protein
MVLPDGFVIEERYVDRVIAAGDLEEYTDIMANMFCPLANKKCRADCMFFNDGKVIASSDGTFSIDLPMCSVFIGGQG